MLKAIALLPILYVAAAITLPLIPVNRDAPLPETGITVFVQSGRYHTELVLPLQEGEWRWDERLGLDTAPPDSTVWLAMAWGDSAFYLNTPTVADISWPLALRALFWPTRGVMQVRPMRGPLAERDYRRRVRLTTPQYDRLAEFLARSFRTDSSGAAIPVAADVYGSGDRFFRARGTYSLFSTCNSWTNAALRHAGVRTGVWSPLVWGVMRHR